METRANIPTGLPKHAPTVSYWQTPPAEIASVRTTETLPDTAETVIIGSGISGASIAHKLLENGHGTVVMLEARQAASGASGRNGGHTKHASYRTYLDNVSTVGVEEAIKMAKLEHDCMDLVHIFIAKHNIECDSRRCDTVDIFHDQTQLNSARHSVQEMTRAMGDCPTTKYTFYDKEEACQKFCTPECLGALVYDAGSLSAYKLTIEILKMALGKGLNLQTNTPALSIEKETGTDGITWKVGTERGPIRTPRLVLATNGYTAHLLPELQGMILPFRGIVTVQRPGTAMPQKGLPTTYSFIYKEGYEYMITRPQGTVHEGDIVIGGGLTKGQGPNGVNEFGNIDDTIVDPDIEQYLTNCTEGYFGTNWGTDHQDGRVRQIWSGIMGYSADGYPLVGPVPDNEGLWIDASFQGHGMVLCMLCADAIVKMMLGQDGPALDAWFPRAFRVTTERMAKKFNGGHEP